MPICIKCKQQLQCLNCGEPQPIGQTVLGCSAKVAGKLWIHVIDDLGNNIEHVPTIGPSEQATNDLGLAMFQDLASGKYEAQLKLPLPSTIASLYDAPPAEQDRKKKVLIEDGTLAHVPFMLTRKARLLVQFVVKHRSDTKAFDAAKITVKAVYKGPHSAPGKNPVSTSTGTADFETVSSGEYQVIPDYSAVSASDWTFDDKPRPVMLTPGKPETVVFELTQKAKVSVEILFKRKSDSDPKTYFTAANIPLKATFQGLPATEVTAATGTKGIAEFPSLLPGKYSFQPDYGAIDRKVYEVDDGPLVADLVAGDNGPLLFEVIRTNPKLRVKIIRRPDPTLKNPPEVLFTDLPVKIQLNGGTPEEVKTGEHDFGPVKAGNHKVTIAFSDPDQNLFDFPDPTEKDRQPTQKEIDLSDKDGLVVFEVEPLYKQVRFIGHCVAAIAKYSWAGTKISNTYGSLPLSDLKATVAEHENKYSKDSWTAKFNGDLTEGKDIDNRVDFISKTLDAAEKAFAAKDDELKILVFPECFFLGGYGAYQVSNIPILMEKLQKLIAGPRWRHWVFVFGTVNGHSAPSPAELGTVPEFFNMSPVVRGGCGESTDNIKLVQKAYYSAEVPDRAELSDLAVYGGKEVTSDKVKAQFQPTEMEALVGLLIQDLLPADPVNEPQVGGQAIANQVTDWPAVRTKVKEYLKANGITWLARDVRGLKTGEANRTFPKEVETFKGVVKSYLEEDREQFYLAGPHVKQPKPVDFETNYPGKLWPEKIQIRVSDHLLARIVERMLSDTEPLIKGRSLADTVAGGLSLESWAKLKSLAKAQVKKNGSIEVARDIRSGESSTEEWVKVFRQLLALYFADSTFTDLRPTLQTPRAQESFRFEDFSVQFKRKPGPWLPEGDTSVPQKKKIVLGVETCADHSKGRLKYSKPGSGVKPQVDIQIVPSAGMGITWPYAAARDKGLVFNCDGWNAVSILLQVLIDRKATFKPHFTDEWPLRGGCNPMMPHTELARVNKYAPEYLLNPSKVRLTIPADQIFGYGPGELHVYEPQNLPA